MAYRIGVLLITLFIGSLALPPRTPESGLFTHANSARIVGGTEAAIGSAPYMMAMSTGVSLRLYVCGGSIIGQRHVLTAAHCIAAMYTAGSLSNTLQLTMGTNHWNLGDSYTVARNITHQHYVSSITKNDIGLLVTSTDIRFSTLVAPVALAFDEVGAGVPVRITGWGRTGDVFLTAPSLLELFVETIDGQHCIEEIRRIAAEEDPLFPVSPVDPRLEICTSGARGYGICHGDSGSPLVRTDRQQQVGVASWGLPCARGAPDIYVRVSAYRDWLLEHTA